MCFRWYKNRELKVKLWWAGALERKKSAFFVTFILSEGIFFNIFAFSPCIVYLINFRNIYTFTYQKTLLLTLLLLVFKITESLQFILKTKILLFCGFIFLFFHFQMKILVNLTFYKRWTFWKFYHWCIEKCPPHNKHILGNH